MRPTCLAAALSLAIATPVFAQEMPAAPAAPANLPSARAVQGGVTIAATLEWLRSIGATVNAPEQAGGRTYVIVNDGSLTWTLWFYTCAQTLCDDIQYSAIFSGGRITPEGVNAWNQGNRFLKAFYVPAEGDRPARAAVQYDVLLMSNGVAQLNDTTATWANMLGKFANQVVFPVREAAPAAAAAAAPAPEPAPAVAPAN